MIQVKRSLEGIGSDKNESMTKREGNIRETYELSLQKTPSLVKLCLKRHKTVSKLWTKKLQDSEKYLQGLRKKPRRSYSKRS